MNLRQIALILTVVALAHAGAFYLVSGWNALPKTPWIPAPNFFAKEMSWLDKATGEMLTYREFQVSTKLAGSKESMPKEQALK